MLDGTSIKTYLLTELVEKVAIFVALVEEESPKTVATLGNAVKVSFLNVVQEESSKKVGINMLHHFDQIGVIELERCGELNHQLMDTVEKLEKNRAAFVQIFASAKQSAPVGELVPELEPLPLH